MWPCARCWCIVSQVLWTRVFKKSPRHKGMNSPGKSQSAQIHQIILWMAVKFQKWIRNPSVSKCFDFGWETKMATILSPLSAQLQVLKTKFLFQIWNPDWRECHSAPVNDGWGCTRFFRRALRLSGKKLWIISLQNLNRRKNSKTKFTQSNPIIPIQFNQIYHWSNAPNPEFWN